MVPEEEFLDQVCIQMHRDRCILSKVQSMQTEDTGLIALYFSRSEMQTLQVVYLYRETRSGMC